MGRETEGIFKNKRSDTRGADQGITRGETGTPATVLLDSEGTASTSSANFLQSIILSTDSVVQGGDICWSQLPWPGHEEFDSIKELRRRLRVTLSTRTRFLVGLKEVLPNNDPLNGSSRFSNGHGAGQSKMPKLC